MRNVTFILTALWVLLAAPDAAQASTPDAVFAAHGLGGTDACLVFVNADAVEHRKSQWRAAIEDLWERNPDALLRWVIGASDPPPRAAREATRQRDCLVELLVRDAGDRRTRLIVDHQAENATKDGMPQIRARYLASEGFRRELHKVLTESDHRDAETQSWIWKRKFVFSGRTFNFVSPRAAERCGLQPNESWKPDRSDHRRCWESALTAAEREQEILQASAAPGISRHHWGTDFDLFSLNPRNFVTGRYADEYLWMTHNALVHGFFQPYTRRDARGERYMEERWHWSYYPIAQALLEFAASHRADVGEALEALWRGYEARWNDRGEERVFFGFVRAHWQEFMFNVDTSAVRARKESGVGASRAASGVNAKLSEDTKSTKRLF